VEREEKRKREGGRRSTLDHLGSPPSLCPSARRQEGKEREVGWLSRSLSWSVCKKREKKKKKGPFGRNSFEFQKFKKIPRRR
jgi:hypothetical protein